MKSSSSRSRYSIVRFALGVAVFALVHSLALAANFPVTVFTDTVATAGGSPAGAGDGAGAAGDLRDAILAANAAGGTNTITFTVGAPPVTITLNGPLPPITSNLTIDGGTFGRVIIDGNNGHRAFFVDTGTVTLKNLQVQNVRAVGGNGGTGMTPGGGGAGFGAGLFVNQATAVVSVQNVQFLNCTVIGGVGGAALPPSGAGGAGGGGGGMRFSGAAGLSTTAGGGGGGGITRAGLAFSGNNGGAGGAGGGGGGGRAGVGTSGSGGSGFAGNLGGSAGGLGTNSNSGGAGGFGGGGGGGGNIGFGGDGGFGGGGGGNGFSFTGAGTGGFGGGGGATAGGGAGGGSAAAVDGVQGGSGGGGTAPNFASGAGGGAAAGPAIFVRLGTVTLVNVAGTTFSATGGLGGASASSTAGTAGTANATAVFNFGGTVNGSTTTGAIATAIQNTAPATHFTLVAQDPAQMFQSYSAGLTVTARDATNAVVTGYNGTVHVTTSDPSGFFNNNDIQLTNGVGTFSTVLKTSPTQSFTATDVETGTITGTVSVTVLPNPADHFSVTAPATASRGVSFSVTVTARDFFNNVDTNYGGTVHFTSSDGAGVLPADATLTNGTGTFSVTLNTGGTQTITATDTVTASITGTSGGTALPSPAVMSVAFNPTTVAQGTDSIMTVTVTNPNTVALTNVQFSNTMPAGLTLITQTGGTAGTLLGTGGGIFSINPAAGTFSSTSNTLAAGASATILVQVRGATLGAKINTTSTVTSNEAAAGAGGTGTLTVIQAAQNFSVSAPSLATAGASFNVTVTALDSVAATATNYTGTVHFTSSDGQAVLPADATLTNGVGTFSVTLKTAGARTITATDTVTASITGNSSTTVSAAAATHLAVVAPGTATAASSFSFTVTALDAFNNTATGYAGTVHFTSTDGAAVLPANSTLTNGVGTLTATLKTAGNQTLTATDTVTGSINGTSGTVTVNPGPATHFAVSAPGTAAAGAAFNFTVTALDAVNNTATGYAGTVHFTSTDGQVVLPADSTLTNGIGTFSGTLKTAGGQTLTATDTVTVAITGTSGTVTVSPGAATHLGVVAPGTATAGTAFNFTVSALDAFNNTVPTYAGTVTLTSTDGQAVLPANSTLTSGTKTFSATLKTAGARTITATDTVTGSITGTSAAVTVAAGPATHLAVTAPGTATAGVAVSFTATALDVFNNTATAYAGTVHFTTGDGQAVLPVNSTLTAGTGTFSATLKTAASQTLTATDTVTSSITGVSGTITVSPAATHHFIVVAPATAQPVSNFTLTVTAVDAFNNTTPTYAGTVHFTSSDGAAAVSIDTALVNGTRSVNGQLRTSGNQTITATDTVTPSITGSATVSVALPPPVITTATVLISNTVQAFDGTQKTVTVTTVPGGLTTTVTYNGSATAPSAPGSYAVVATVASASFTGSATATLTIGRGTQIVTFTPAAGLRVGEAFTLRATASSGLPVTFTLVSGNATLTGATLTPADSNPVVVRATQAGNDTYGAVSVDQTITDITKAAQTITFAALADRPPTDAPFAVSATASSGLPVSLAVVSGPATISGGTVTLTGTAGAVVIRATQAGNAAYAAAPTVDRSFTVIEIKRVLGHFINVSARARAGVGGQTFIVGFVLGGTSSRQMLVRGVGPGLAQFGVPGTVANPAIRIERNGTLIAQNDDWDVAGAGAGISTAAVSAGAFALQRGSTDAALLNDLPVGGYTAQLTTPNGDTGIALAEMYEAGGGAVTDPHMLNFSVRASAGSGDATMIVGFVVTGDVPTKILVRAVGPGLAQFGVTGVLTDPLLTVFSGSNSIASNSDWNIPSGADAADAAQKSGAFPLTQGSKDAALVITVPPGAYTVKLTGAEGGSGVALVEVYEVP